MRSTRTRTALALAVVAVLCLLGLPGAASAAVPTAPALNADVNADDSIDLVWTPIAGAVKYRIYEDLRTPSNGYGAGDGVADTTDTKSRRGPLSDDTYRFGVTAINADGESVLSNKVTVTVPAPAGTPTVTVNEPDNGDTVSGTITLSATTDEPGEDVMEYLIDGQLVADDGAGDNADGFDEPWDSTTVADGRHYFQARATDLDGESKTTAPDLIIVDNGVVTPPPAAACEDGTDNDADTLTDYPADPGCTSATDDDETDTPVDPPVDPAACEDGTDNDGDGLTDLADPGCADATDTDETDRTDPPADPPTDPPADPAEPSVPGSGPVPANDETQAFASGTGDLADDPAIYVDSTDPTRSVVIGSKKAASGGGLGVYDLNGDQLSFMAGGELNNVDLRTVGDKVVVLTTERGSNTLKFFFYDPATRTLANAGSFATGFEPYGGCLYQSGTDLYGFVTNRNAGFDFDQYALTVGSSVTGSKVRDLSTSSLSESCVADDEGGHVYLSQEDNGVYRYAAAPTGGSSRTTVAAVGSNGVTADVEGLAIARGRGADHADHLIVSSQGANTYQVFDLATSAFVKSFTVAASTDGSVDAVSGTDGLEVTRADLGPAYPDGLLVVHDTSNGGGSVSNFKLVDAGLVLGSYGTTPTDPTDPAPPAGDRGPAGSVTIWEDDFEGGLDCSIWERVQNQVTSNSGTNTDCSTWAPDGDGSRLSFPQDGGDQGTGDRYARFELRNGDVSAPGAGTGHRSEISGDSAPWQFHDGDERWIQMRIYKDTAGMADTILTQFHAGQNSPPLELGLDGTSLTLDSHADGTVPTTVLATASEWPAGTWIDVNLHVKWSQSASTGGAEVFVNGERKTPWLSGQTMNSTSDRIYVKTGLYRGSDTAGTYVARFDDLVLSRN